MNNQTKIILGLIVAVLVVWGGYSIYNKQTTEPTENEVIKIGFIGPLTGQNAFIGEGIRNAIELAESKKQNVIIIYEDDQFNGKLGITAYHKLRDIDKVDAIINTTPATINAFQPILQENPLIVIQIAEPEIIEDDTVYQIMPAGASVYAKLGEIAKEKYNSIAFIYQIGPAFEKVKNAFREAYTKESSSKLKEYQIGEIGDYRTEVTKIINEGFDAFTIVVTPNVGIPFLKQFTQQNKDDIQLLCNGDLEVTIASYLENAIPEEVFEGCYSAMFVDRMAESFKIEYKNVYGTDPSFAADYAYDAVNILIDTYAEDVQKWKNNIQEIVYSGVSGDIKFDNNGVRLPEVEIHIFESGGFVKYEE